ncbi:HNH endonuclease [Rhodococcus sp. DMU2021]|uniref:HNH endonuclease signature motif containing protein n=1 Tax=Rhodococcus sp. DMU2021 TaxID=2866997 RepID=UPI001C7CDB94|nr:HNH endonuclease signature motif containing protein [Rhodococcus sp. DMU2021]MBX4170435.1 HNH endonuclease [Rhodococcus sp. DMU2021]
MTSWIVKINEKTPQHWDYARDDGFWDVRSPSYFRKIVPGDDIYFWITGQGNGFVARARATSGLYEITPSSQPAHWSDVQTGGYTHRFEFETISEDVVSSPTWAQLQKLLGKDLAAQAGANQVSDPSAESRLRSLFGTEADLAFAHFPVVDVELPKSLPTYEKGDDVRKRAQRAIAVRYGQPKFRRALLAAYERRCAVTGCDVEAVLEAAHIDRYFGEHSNHVTNGLLLRADLHTLFDLQLWTVRSDLTVAVAPQLESSEYAAFAGKRIRVPKSSAHHPDAAALARHRDACDWVRSAS